MVEIDIIEQKPVSLVDVKEMLENAKKNTKELNFRAEKVYTYLQEFVTIKEKNAYEFHKKISDLGIQRLKDKYIVKIIDVMPEDLDSLKALFAGEAISLKQDEIKQILDILNG